MNSHCCYSYQYLVHDDRDCWFGRQKKIVDSPELQMLQTSETCTHVKKKVSQFAVSCQKYIQRLVTSIVIQYMYLALGEILEFFSIQFRRLTCLANNFQISQLYLQNNQLTDITGALQHLTCLEVLMLHNNQLTKLDKVVKEFKKMQSLRTLSEYFLLWQIDVQGLVLIKKY